MTSFSHDNLAGGAPAIGDGAVRIACVYTRDYKPEKLASMSGLRLYRMAAALARRGHEVDIVVNRNPQPHVLAPRLREVPFRLADWDEYDVVKTLFHVGMQSLVAEGGGDHPFIVSKLGSVVGHEQTDGVYFFGRVREDLYRMQQEVAARASLVTVLTNRSAALWWDEHGYETPLCMVPTGVDAEIPAPRCNPYPALGIDQPVALFAGNIYSREQQAEVNLLWQERLNRIGTLLKRRGIRLVAMGTGVTDRLDPAAVTHLGPILADQVWDFQRFAKVGNRAGAGPGAGQREQQNLLLPAHRIAGGMRTIGPQ